MKKNRKKSLWKEVSRSEEEIKAKRQRKREKERDVGWCQELIVTIQCNAVSSMGFEEEIYQWVLTIRFNYLIAINSSI